MEILTAGQTCRVSAGDLGLTKLVECCAEETGRPFRPLHLQALLQMPRLADQEGRVEISGAKVLMHEIAEELPASREWTVDREVRSPHGLTFQAIQLTLASKITEKFHYLRSPRSDGRAYGLVSTAGALVALCVSSPLDVDQIKILLDAAGHSGEATRVISRVFVFEGAPRNCISYLLSRTGREERLSGIRNLVTYVNPNMGFTGISYRASGWHLLGEEHGTTYRYLDCRYITDRRLAAVAGRFSDEEYLMRLGDRYAVSRMPLAPLLLFHSHLA